jgi:hypothetical protein
MAVFLFSCGTWISALLADQSARSLSRSAYEAPPELRPTLATVPLC